LYFVFECCNKGSLDELIREAKGDIPHQLIKIIFAQFVNSLEYLQGHGMMHRDLKPQNMMLDDNYNMKLIDFGDARKVFEELDDDDDDGPPAERRDTFVGTVNYQSPEVIKGETQGYGVDIWAAGCILFKLFVGKVPFKGTNPMVVYKDIKERKIGWPEES